MIPLLYAMLTMVLSACQSDDAKPAELGDRLMPVYLSIPANGGYVTRGAGDPRTVGDDFTPPTKLYLYVVKETIAGTSSIHQQTSDLDGSWNKTVVGGETIYQYSGHIEVELTDFNANNREAIRVYAAVSPVALENLSAVTDEDDIRNLTVDLPDDNHQYEYIKDIYSTPADYETDGQYYCTVEDPEKPSVSLSLYHVAAKVDVIWNVATAMQPAVRLKQVALAGLRRKGCRLFRPMQNTPPTSNTYQTTVTTDGVGSQWMGRHSFYVIPCVQSSTLPLELHLWQDDDDTADGYTQHINIPMTETTFTPWVRQDILISKTLK